MKRALLTTFLLLLPACYAETRVVNVLAMVLQVCNLHVAVQPQAVQAVLTATNTPSVSRGLAECSYGKVALQASVVPQVIPVPCPAVSCDYRSWAGSADAYALQLGLNLSAVHLVYVLPAGGLCQIGGLGEVGGSRVWIHGDVATQANTYMHELSHNLGLQHAGMAASQDVYADLSDAMGYCCSLRCYNPPHLEQLGWGSPATVLSTADGSLPIMQVISLQLPHSMSGPAHYARIQMGGRWVYLQYRKRVGWDAGLAQCFSDSVNVYSVPAGVLAQTWLEGVLQLAQQPLQVGSLTISLASDIDPTSTQPVQVRVHRSP